MEEAPKSAGVVRFGAFEIDIGAGELRKRGLKVKVQDRPFQILALLVGRPGQVVTREELRKTLWPVDTFVDFDNGINTAVNKLREALGDSADNPRFIETVDRRGYRWITEVNRPTGPESPAPEEPRAGEAVVTAAPRSGLSLRAKAGGLAPRLLGSRRRVALLAAAVTFVLTALVSFWWLSPSPLPRVIRSIEITHSGRVELWGRIVTDGGRLYYLEREGHRWNLVQTSAAGGEAEAMRAPFENTRILDVSPDHTEFLLGSFVVKETEMPLWIMPVAGGSPRRVGEITASDAVWGPDGTTILYVKGSDLYLEGRDGASPRKLCGTGGQPERMAWSPDRRALRFTLKDPAKDSYSLWEAAADGTRLHPLLAGWSNPPGECCGHWTPDARYFLFSSNHGGSSNIWALRETSGLFRRPRRQPVQLTTGPTDFTAAVPSSDGKRLFVLGKQPQVEFVRYDAKSRRFPPFLAGTRAWWVSFSRNGQWIAYDSEGTLFRIRMDGSSRLQLTFAPLGAHDSRWSPDGKQIAFWGGSPGESLKTYLVSSEGGPPREVAPGWGNRERPDWSPDGGSLVFEVSEAPDPRANGLYVVDLKTQRVSELPSSAGMSFPRWSPTGRTLAATGADQHRLALFDFETRQWTQVAQGTLLTGPVWSRDGKDLYFQDLLAAGEPVYRLRADSRRPERVPGCENLLQPGIVRCALVGLDPDEAPVFQLFRGLADIYALDLDLP